MSPERQKLLQSIADAYDPARHKVLLVADTDHYKTHEIAGLVADSAEALRAKGITAVGFEGIPAHDQAFLDSLAAREIDRNMFLMHLGTGGSEHLSKEDTGVFLGHIADLIEGGIHVYGLGDAYYAPQNPDLEDLNFRCREMGTRIKVDYLKFAAQTRDLQSSPRAVYDRMLRAIKNDASFPGGDGVRAGRSASGHIQSGISRFSGAQIERIMQIDSEISGTPEPRDDGLYRQGVYDIFLASHPQYDDVLALEEKLVSAPAAEGAPDVFLRARLDADSKIAAHIQKILEQEGGMVVQYGFSHTVTSFVGENHSADMPDLDGALRKAGIGVMIVDPYFGEPGKIDCTPLTAAIDCAKFPALGRKALEAAQSSNDPDRYVIPDIKGPTLTKDGPLRWIPELGQ